MPADQMTHLSRITGSFVLSDATRQQLVDAFGFAPLVSQLSASVAATAQSSVASFAEALTPAIDVAKLAGLEASITSTHLSPATLRSPESYTTEAVYELRATIQRQADSMEDQARDLQAAQDERDETDKIRHDQQMRIQRLHLIVGVLVGVLTALTLVVGLGWLR